MIPIVTVWPTPSGLPTARTTSPTLHVLGVADARSDAGRRRSTFSSGEVARLVGADQLRGQRAVVGQLDLDVVGAVDDVVVGQDVAVGRHDDAGAERPLPRRALLRGIRWPR